MKAPPPRLRCYLVEWYRPTPTAKLLDDVVATLDKGMAWTRAEGSTVQLLMALAVPDDELVFGVFAASSLEVVAELCDRAGCPAQRLSQAIDTPSGTFERRRM